MYENTGLKELKVYQKAYDFNIYIRALVLRFARIHKYSLGVELESAMLHLVSNIVRAYYLQGREKINILCECLVTLEIIQMYIRMGHELRMQGGISVKHYEVASQKIDELRKMIFVWRRSLGQTRGSSEYIFADSREG